MVAAGATEVVGKGTDRKRAVPRGVIEVVHAKCERARGGRKSSVLLAKNRRENTASNQQERVRGGNRRQWWSHSRTGMS